jgi:hypothetical protein
MAELESKTVAQLKEMLRHRSLSCSGNKATLIDRLRTTLEVTEDAYNDSSNDDADSHVSQHVVDEKDDNEVVFNESWTLRVRTRS